MHLFILNRKLRAYKIIIFLIKQKIQKTYIKMPKLKIEKHKLSLIVLSYYPLIISSFLFITNELTEQNRTSISN